ncbi:MAG: 16S rRNA (guanine(966)-N(2))-methyltransferase RsmD [Coriobacteriia bacterium]|nr:16S rRNA (guanine(966)-N(2))-methyltransferase RsmD [Coriobacteriia bacterium]
MRIIAGKYGGRKIDVPKGLEVRPTIDRVREAMFSSLISIYGSIDGASVLDAFAGSGALGFEAISRGAKNLISFENNKRNYENLVENYQMLKDDDSNIKLLFADVKKAKFEHVCQNIKFDLLFFDPPYENLPSDVLDILKALVKVDAISNGAVIVYEHASKDSFDAYVELFAMDGFSLVNSKEYNEVAVEYLKYV